MAFAIGEFIGGFIAAIFIPLFLFYFAGKKGRSLRAAVILRSIAVLIAVLALVAEMVGSGGQFPAGAALAVLVCFVWAFRASLRDRGRGLNGWQRLGVILSLVWLPVGYFGSVALYVSSQAGPWQGIYKMCLVNADQFQQNRVDRAGFASQNVDRIQNAWAQTVAAGNFQRAATLQAELTSAKRELERQRQGADGTLQSQDYAKCSDEFNKDYAESIAGRWWGGLIGMLVPLALFWLVAWVSVRLYRWVRAGFVREHA